MDLNVSPKFYDYNMMGVPQGWNAFFIRGYADRADHFEAEYEIAKSISKKDRPNVIVYGGGKKIKKMAEEKALVYVEQVMTIKHEEIMNNEGGLPAEEVMNILTDLA
jgi:hypothetical protein